MRNLPLILVGLLVLAGLGGLLLLSSGAQDRRLDASVIGLAALEPWLDRQGLAAEQANPRIRPDITQIGLRLLPLYDVNLIDEAPAPATPKDSFYASTLREQTLFDIQTRLTEVPTLLIWPKWVAGTVVAEVAHDSALIPQPDLNRLSRQLGLGAMALDRAGARFLTADLPQGKLTLFHAQLFNADDLPRFCTPELALPEGVLIARCQLPQKAHPTWILSDPDLLNNHGLTLGENARIVTGLLQGWVAPPAQSDKNRPQNSPQSGPDTPAPEEARRIYIDTSGENLVTWYDYADEAQAYERDSTDFARFFQPPLTGLWAMLLIVLGVALWRGLIRFGPARPDPDEAPEQSKTAAIATNARLLRIAGHDGRMVADFVQAGLTDLAITTFGRSAGSGPAGLTRLYAHLGRRDAKSAQALQALATRLTDRTTPLPPAELRRSLDTYRRLLETLTHDTP